jgi:hypothetical protein
VFREMQKGACFRPHSPVSLHHYWPTADRPTGRAEVSGENGQPSTGGVGRRRSPGDKAEIAGVRQRKLPCQSGTEVCWRATRAWLSDGTADWFWPAAEKAGLAVMFLAVGERIVESKPSTKQQCSAAEELADGLSELVFDIGARLRVSDFSRHAIYLPPRPPPPKRQRGDDAYDDRDR